MFGRVRLRVVITLMFVLAPFLGLTSTVLAAPADTNEAATMVAYQDDGEVAGNTIVTGNIGPGASVQIDGGTVTNSTTVNNIDASDNSYTDNSTTYQDCWEGWGYDDWGNYVWGTWCY